MMGPFDGGELSTLTEDLLLCSICLRVSWYLSNALNRISLGRRGSKLVQHLLIYPERFKLEIYPFVCPSLQELVKNKKMSRSS